MNSKSEMYMGRNNPNCKHKDINDNLFAKIDSEIKAYILGRVISDGWFRKNTWGITLHEKDVGCLNMLAKHLSSTVAPRKLKNKPQFSLVINSKTMVQDLRNLISVENGPKAKAVQMPKLENRELQLACIRGIFDGDGSVTDPSKNLKLYLIAKISTSSSLLRSQISDTIGVPCYNGGSALEWSCNNALDFLGLIYSNSNYYLERKHRLYKLWCNYVPGLGGFVMSNYVGNIKCIKTRKDAILPHKVMISDSGYDVTCIEKIKELGDVSFYTTGIKVQPPFGWALDLRARSSISKTGFILANGVGTIDRTYMGEVIVPLRKVDKSAPDLILPFKLAQIVPVPVCHMHIEEVNDLNETYRGSGGFGSSGK